MKFEVKFCHLLDNIVVSMPCEHDHPIGTKCDLFRRQIFSFLIIFIAWGEPVRVVWGVTITSIVIKFLRRRNCCSSIVVLFSTMGPNRMRLIFFGCWSCCFFNRHSHACRYDSGLNHLGLLTTTVYVILSFLSCSAHFLMSLSNFVWRVQALWNYCIWSRCSQTCGRRFNNWSLLVGR